MKKRIVWMTIMMSCFLTACSGQERAEEAVHIEVSEMEEETEPMQEVVEELRPEFASEEFVSDEAIYSQISSNVLRFEDRIFIGDDCYEYRDGYYYYLQGQGIAELVPEGMEDAYQTQTREFLIFCENVHEETGWVDRVMVVEPCTGEVVKCFDLQEFSAAGMIAFEGTYEDSIYYRTYDYNTETATVEVINCVNMSHEIIFELDEFIRNVTVREDGSFMVSALDVGWFKIDPQGQATFMLEKIDGVWDEYVKWYGESGYYTLAEYHHGVEVLHITEDGTRERLDGFCDFWEDVFLENYFINIDEAGRFQLYDYIYMPIDIDADYGRADAWYEKNIGENPPFKTLQVIEEEIMETGYRVEEYYTCDNKVWLFLKKGKELVVRSWKIGDREEWVREQQIMNGDFSILTENELVSIADIESLYSRAKGLDNIEWCHADLNGDDAEELIWVEKNSPSEESKRIVAIFTGGETNECIMWDISDVTEYYFLGDNGNLIHYSQYFGMYEYVRYENYTFDEDWNLEMQYALSVYEVYDVLEMEEWWREEHPDMMWTGRYFRIEEGNGCELQSVTAKQFNDLYMKMAGHQFEFSEDFSVERYELYYGVFRKQ